MSKELVEYITDDEGHEVKKVKTIQDNGWIRYNYYHEDGTVEEIYEKPKKEYDPQKWYSFYYHYMHDYPSTIVKVECRGCLLERTLELLKKDPMVLIDDIKENE